MKFTIATTWGNEIDFEEIGMNIIEDISNKSYAKYEIEIESLEKLMDMVTLACAKSISGILITNNKYKDIPHIEIYDDYRE